MVRAWKVGKACGVEIALHWTLWVLPACVLAHGLIWSTAENALLNIAVLLALYFCVLVQEFAHALVADRFGIGTRDVLLFPVCGVARLTRIGERPWQEIWIAAVGPLVHAAIAGLLWLWFWEAGASLTPKLDRATPYRETFFNRLFWCNVLLTVVNVLPMLPFDGGRMFRGALALSTSRLRATEVSVLLSTIIAIGLCAAAIFWLESPLLAALALFIYLMSQHELMQTRVFASLQSPAPGKPTPTAVVPVSEVVNDENRPAEPDFTGFVWNARARLWIEWKNGEPISANALLGE